MMGVNGLEFVLLLVIAAFVLGPDRLPEYAAKLARGIRKVRVMAEVATGQLKEQIGPEYGDINWRQYDPRQYDPRRIVKEALLDPLDDAIAPLREEIGSLDGVSDLRGATAVAATTTQGPRTTVDATTASGVTVWGSSRPTPYDIDAT